MGYIGVESLGQELHKRYVGLDGWANQVNNQLHAEGKKTPWCFSTWAISGFRVDAYEYGLNPSTNSAMECWELCQATSGCIATTWFYTPRVTGYAGDVVYSAAWKVTGFRVYG